MDCAVAAWASVRLAAAAKINREGVAFIIDMRFPLRLIPLVYAYSRCKYLGIFIINNFLEIVSYADGYIFLMETPEIYILVYF